MRYAGVCGSDIHYFAAGRIGEQIVNYPFVLGHEGSGEVREGDGRFPAGLPIYIEPALCCHTCDQCLEGRENTCRNLKFLGNPLELSGCMCEEIVLPPECVVPLPEWLPLKEAVLLEPLSIGIHAVKLARSRPGMRAAIVGAGPIGLVVLLALSEVRPGQALVSEPVEARRKAAEALGGTQSFDPGKSGAAEHVFEASDGGVDVAFECAGTQESIDDACRMLRPGGTVVLIGIPEAEGGITYDPHLMRRRELTMVSVRRQNGDTEQAISLLKKRRDAAGVLLTHCFPAARAGEAFQLVHRKADRAIKVLLDLASE
jgi:L-iditol 2-dehydrogenase